MISMLQFSNSTIIVAKTKLKNIMVIKSILTCFELTSRLKVNFHKSKLVSIWFQQRSLNNFLLY